MHKKITKEFIKFVAKELKLKSLPKKITFVDAKYSSENLSFGGYNTESDSIVVSKTGRHLADVLRTLAHELVHHKQKESGQSLDGSAGSNTENEANAMAGTLMRKFKEIHPEIFSMSNTDSPDKMKKILKVVKTGQPQKIDETYIDSFTAKLLLTVTHKLTPDNKHKFLNESIDNMIAIAYKMITK